MAYPKTFTCVDCSQESDCQWCDCCTRPVCTDCDLTHDCLAQILEADDEESSDDED